MVTIPPTTTPTMTPAGGSELSDLKCKKGTVVVLNFIVVKKLLWINVHHVWCKLAKFHVNTKCLCYEIFVHSFLHDIYSTC